MWKGVTIQYLQTGVEHSSGVQNINITNEDLP